MRTQLPISNRFLLRLLFTQIGATKIEVLLLNRETER